MTRTIKALTVWQPSASLIILGLKTKEIRRWRTRYRGLLALHAGVRLSRSFYGNPEVYEALKERYPNHLFLPQSKVLGFVELRGDCPSLELDPTLPEVVKGFSRRGPECWAWDLAVRRVLETPVPAWGRQGLWNWEVPDNLEIEL